MRTCKIKYYYTMQEGLAFLGDLNLPFESSQATWFDFLDDIFSSAPIFKKNESNVNIALIDHLEDLFQLIFSRHYEDYIFESYYNENDYDTIHQAEAKHWLRKFINLVIMTKDKYIKLLDLYADNEAKLLDKIESIATGVVRFNDTPQNAETNDEFEADKHVNNISKSIGTSSTDGMTLINRLNEIQNMYKNILMAWANEFNSLFVEEENIKDGLEVYYEN